MRFRPRVSKAAAHTFCCANIKLNYPLTIDAYHTAINAHIKAFMTHAQHNVIPLRSAPLAPYHFRVVLTKLTPILHPDGGVLIMKETQLRNFAPDGAGYCEIEHMLGDQKYVLPESSDFPILHMWKCCGAGEDNHHTQLHVFMQHLHTIGVDPDGCGICVQGERHREAEDDFNRLLPVGQWVDVETDGRVDSVGGDAGTDWEMDGRQFKGDEEPREDTQAGVMSCWEEEMLKELGLGLEAGEYVVEVGPNPEASIWMLDAP